MDRRSDDATAVDVEIHSAAAFKPELVVAQSDTRRRAGSHAIIWGWARALRQAN